MLHSCPTHLCHKTLRYLSLLVALSVPQGMLLKIENLFYKQACQEPKNKTKGKVTQSTEPPGVHLQVCVRETKEDRKGTARGAVSVPYLHSFIPLPSADEPTQDHRNGLPTSPFLQQQAYLPFLRSCLCLSPKTPLHHPLRDVPNTPLCRERFPSKG